MDLFKFWNLLQLSFFKQLDKKSQLTFLQQIVALLFLQVQYINSNLRCFDTVFQWPYRYFSIALKVVFSLSDRYNIFTSIWLWIEICENVVLSKIDITMTTINEQL